MGSLFPSVLDSHSAKSFRLSVLTGIATTLLILSKETPSAFNCLFSNVPWHGYSPTDFAVPLLLHATGANLVNTSFFLPLYQSIVDVGKLLLLSVVVDGLATPKPEDIFLPFSEILQHFALASLPLVYLLHKYRGSRIPSHAFYSLSFLLIGLHVLLTYTLHTCDSQDDVYQSQCSAAGTLDFILRGAKPESIGVSNFRRALSRSRMCPSTFDTSTPKFDSWVWLNPYGLYSTINASAGVLAAGYLHTYEAGQGGIGSVLWAFQLAIIAFVLDASKIVPIQHELYTVSYLFLSVAAAAILDECVRQIVKTTSGQALLMPFAAIGSNMLWVLCITHFGLVEVFLGALYLPSSRTVTDFRERVCLIAARLGLTDFCRYSPDELEPPSLFAVPSNVSMFDVMKYYCAHLASGNVSTEELYVAGSKVALVALVTMGWIGRLPIGWLSLAQPRLRPYQAQYSGYREAL